MSSRIVSFPASHLSQCVNVLMSGPNLVTVFSSEIGRPQRELLPFSTLRLIRCGSGLQAAERHPVRTAASNGLVYVTNNIQNSSGKMLGRKTRRLFPFYAGGSFAIVLGMWVALFSCYFSGTRFGGLILKLKKATNLFRSNVWQFYTFNRAPF